MLAEVFQEESLQLMTEMRDAIAAGDARWLQRAAHSLKGAVGIFGATVPLQGVQQLEAQRKELILEGVCGIVEGLNPKLIRSKLEAYTHQIPAGKKKAEQAKAGPSQHASPEAEAKA